MIIQQNSLNSVLGLYSSLAHRPKLADTAATASVAPATNLADKVTISQDARDRLDEANKKDLADNWAVSFRDKMVAEAKQDPAFAEKMAREYAYDTSYETHGPLIDISHPPEIRYSHTQEVVTDENLATFKKDAAEVTAGRIALYQNEKAKGTPDAEILQKLYDYTNTQSDNYLSKVGWKPNVTGSEKPSYDFTHMSPEHLLSTINELIKSGQMSLDETSALIFLIPSPV